MPADYEKIIHKHPESYTAQIITLDAHCSNLNARLVATLDALDDLQRSHHFEIEQLSQRVNTLQARSRILKTRAKLAEAERDGLKEGVDRLLEKGGRIIISPGRRLEIANDYRILPRSRIHVPYPLEPIITDSRLTSQQIHHPNSQDAFINSLITTLTNQLTASKAEFAELKCASDARIAILEARVARREAELHAYRPCPCSCHPHGPSECDVERSSGSTKDNSHAAAAQLPEQRVPASFSKDQVVEILHETAVRHRVLQADVEGLLDFARSTANKARTTNDESHERPTTENLAQAQEKLSRPNVASIISISSSRPQPTVPTLGAILGIDRRLSNVEQDTNDLRAERDNIAAVLCGEDRLKGILLIEEECLRLRKTERTLRQQLLLASTAEQDLKALVEKLQRKIEDRLHDSESGDEGTTGMEPDNGTDPIDPPDAEDDTARPSHICEPHTTPMVSSLLPEATFHENKTPFDTVSASHAIQTTRLARIESDLEDARADVESKERTIDSLKAQLAVLKRAVALQPGG
ncbi:hypothetical protein BU17DRAFT_83600 [Hysterangium stoloniferum]|nr:hypothetical protein BU17DRAFT_83600 [Hysterangium stoloniferum]